MNLRAMIVGLLCLGVTWAATANDKPVHSASATNAAFDKMKTLVGTWVAADDNGQPTDRVISVIRLTAGGSALHETIFPGQPEEMISIYTPEGSDVVMTHYCIAGNQPQMRAKSASPGSSLNFEFVGGTNLNPKKDKHMHSAVLTFIDDDHYEVEGVAWDNGKPAPEMCGKMKLVRKK